MCLAIPAKLLSIEDNMGTIDMAGIQKRVSLILLEEVQVGDYIIVHAGFGIHRIDEEEAMEKLTLLRQMASLLDDDEAQDAEEEEEITGFGTPKTQE